jgi:hypothetical protein
MSSLIVRIRSSSTTYSGLYGLLRTRMPVDLLVHIMADLVRLSTFDEIAGLDLRQKRPRSRGIT